MGWRTEQLYGEGYTNPCEVMAHEVFELENADILVTLGDGILKGTPIGDKLLYLANVIDEKIEDEEVEEFLYDAFGNEKIGQSFFEKVVGEIEKITGKKLESTLWLCNSIEDILSEYKPFDGEILDTFDEYENGFVVLFDMGKAGKLYGYEEKPAPINTVFINEASLDR